MKDLAHAHAQTIPKSTTSIPSLQPNTLRSAKDRSIDWHQKTVQALKLQRTPCLYLDCTASARRYCVSRTVYSTSQKWWYVDYRTTLQHFFLIDISIQVIAASIVTRGGKAVLSRQFREIARSRVEALLASFPKLTDSGTQHTVVEQDNVRFVYQPLDELYMVLITNKQSNILQDIDSLHLFAQVVSTVCKKLDEREILRNAFELLSAFDELVTAGYRENLSLSQIKTFLEMESHEERIQEIIARVRLESRFYHER